MGRVSLKELERVTRSKESLNEKINSLGILKRKNNGDSTKCTSLVLVLPTLNRIKQCFLLEIFPNEIKK